MMNNTDIKGQAGPGFEDGVLAIDIGAGTQDILVWQGGVPVENCPKMILPSPTTILARRIRRATNNREHVFLSGNTMGGGPCGRAVRDHIKAGLRVFATQEAALTFNDNLEKIAKMGIELVSSRPGLEPLVELQTGDVDIEAIHQILKRFEVPLPETVAVAVQDHGYCPNGSNRITRFEMWKTALHSGKGLHQLIYMEPPEQMTRMAAAKQAAPNAWVMDTGAAAIVGAQLDPWIEQKRREGVMIVNIGNEHVLAALVKNTQTFGIYEHHISLVNPDKLKAHLDKFRRGLLSNQEVFEDMGHGCLVHPDATRVSDFSYIGLTGPNRGSYSHLGGHMAAPFGDMMLTGCFGLIYSLVGIRP